MKDLQLTGSTLASAPGCKILPNGTFDCRSRRAELGGTMRAEGGAPASDAQQEDAGSPTERPSVADYALLEELRFVRREAQAEANVAYEDWVALPSGESYSVYRAAQDRADAAQDRLADWAAELSRELDQGPLALQTLT
jgi:hypothetical protein